MNNDFSNMDASQHVPLDGLRESLNRAMAATGSTTVSEHMEKLSGRCDLSGIVRALEDKKRFGQLTKDGQRHLDMLTKIQGSQSAFDDAVALTLAVREVGGMLVRELSRLCDILERQETERI